MACGAVGSAPHKGIKSTAQLTSVAYHFLLQRSRTINVWLSSATGLARDAHKTSECHDWLPERAFEGFGRQWASYEMLRGL